MNYESANTCFPPTTILVPTPTGAWFLHRPDHGSHWLFESSWSAFARSTPFLEQGIVLQRHQLQPGPTASRPTPRWPTRPLPFLYCPSDPGSHIDDATLGRYRLCDDKLRHLRRRLVRLVGQLGSHQFGGPDEQVDVRPQLLPQDRHGHRRSEQYPDGFGGPHRPRPDAELLEHSVGSLPPIRRHSPAGARRTSRPRPGLDSGAH